MTQNRVDEHDAVEAPAPRGLCIGAHRPIADVFAEVEKVTSANDPAGLGLLRNEDVYLSMMPGRRLLALATRPVSLELRGGEASVVIDGEAAAPLGDDAVAYLGQYLGGDGALDGTIAVLIDATLGAPEPALVVSHEHRIVKVVVEPGHRVEALPLKALDELGRRSPTGAGFASGFAASVGELLAQFPDAAGVLDTDKARATLWEFPALVMTTDKETVRAALADSLKEFGLFDTFGGDSDALDAYVRASLVASVAPFPSMLRLVLQRAEMDFETLLARLDAIGEKWWLPTVYSSGNCDHDRVWFIP